MSCFDQWLLAGGHISPLKGIKVWKLELEMKVDPNACNHGEGHGHPYDLWVSVPISLLLTMGKRPFSIMS